MRKGIIKRGMGSKNEREGEGRKCPIYPSIYLSIYLFIYLALSSSHSLSLPPAISLALTHTHTNTLLKISHKHFLSFYYYQGTRPFSQAISYLKTFKCVATPLSKHTLNYLHSSLQHMQHILCCNCDPGNEDKQFDIPQGSRFNVYNLQ